MVGYSCPLQINEKFSDVKFLVASIGGNLVRKPKQWRNEFIDNAN